MVPGDHDRADTGRREPLDGPAHALRRRIGDAHKPDQHERAELVRSRADLAGLAPVGHGQDPQPESRQPTILRRPVLPSRSVQQGRNAVDELVGGELEQAARCALHGSPNPFLAGVAGCRKLETTREGDRGDSLPERGDAPVVEARLPARHEQRDFGGIARRPVSPVLLEKTRIVGQDTDRERFEQSGHVGGIGLTSVQLETPVRRKAHTADADFTLAQDDVRQRHLAGRQRSGLVRAHDRGGPQSLDRRRIAHQGAPAGHTAKAYGLCDRENDR